MDKPDWLTSKRLLGSAVLESGVAVAHVAAPMVMDQEVKKKKKEKNKRRLRN